jgi:peptide/nickel transport system permease protein
MSTRTQDSTVPQSSGSAADGSTGSDDDLRATETPGQEVRVYINKRSIIFRRFLRNKPAVVGCVVLMVVIVFALLGNLPNGWRYDDLDAYAAGGAAPSAVHWFGANTAGADVYALLVRGTQKSLLIGALVGIITPLVAAVYGTALAYFGGWVERIGLFILETMIMMPVIIMIAILMNGRGGGWITLSVLLIVFGWMGTARLVRALASSLVQLDYVRAAKYMGAPAARTIRKHLVPNIASLVVLNVTMSIWGAILSEVSYSFIGIGVKLPDTSLGMMVSQAAGALSHQPWLFWAPVVMLFFITIPLALINDGLRDALDPNSLSAGVSR